MLDHLKKDKVALVSAIAIAAMVIIAVFAPVFSPYDPLRIDLDA
ncbi:MAG TPA: ABC transporter permease, partial [Nitrospirota bacterium]